MKICTITCQNADNHGARLQCFALAYWLKKNGHDVIVIYYRPVYMRGPRLWYIPIGLKSFVKFFLRFFERIRLQKRHKIFSAFSAQFIPLTRTYYCIDELRQNPPEADLYIAGSDQIWNPTFRNGTDPAYYLDFGAEGVRRESFAASFAVSIISDLKKKAWISDRLRRFDKITVRAQSALTILKELGSNGELQEDPVFLLSAEEWNMALSLDEEWHRFNVTNERYVLVYDFFLSDAIKEAAINYRRKHQCKIYSVCHENLTYADKNFIYASPVDFVNLVRHASCVISNSFHGTCFAMIFNVPYVIVDRPDGLNERMRDLLQRRQLPCQEHHSGEGESPCIE